MNRKSTLIIACSSCRISATTGGSSRLTCTRRRRAIKRSLAPLTSPYSAHTCRSPVSRACSIRIISATALSAGATLIQSPNSRRAPPSGIRSGRLERRRCSPEYFISASPDCCQSSPSDRSMRSAPSPPAALKAIAALRPSVDRFFDAVLVMASQKIFAGTT